MRSVTSKIIRTKSLSTLKEIKLKSASSPWQLQWFATMKKIFAGLYLDEDVSVVIAAMLRKGSCLHDDDRGELPSVK